MKRGCLGQKFFYVTLELLARVLPFTNRKMIFFFLNEILMEKIIEKKDGL